MAEDAPRCPDCGAVMAPWGADVKRSRWWQCLACHTMWLIRAGEVIRKGY